MLDVNKEFEDEITGPFENDMANKRRMKHEEDEIIKHEEQDQVMEEEK